MPDLVLTPSPAANPAIAGNAAAAVDAAAETVQGSPFATVLQEQLAAQILMPVPDFVGLPAVESAAEAPADAIQQLLLGMAAQSATPGAGLQAAAADLATGEAVDATAAAGLAADASALVPLALPAMALPPGQAQQKVGAGETAHDSSAATSATEGTAILAATADAAKAGRPAIAGGKAEEALAMQSEHAAPRAEAVQQAPSNPARIAEQPVRIEAPLGSRQWDGEFANRLAWMVGKQEQRADLVLTPPQLGRIEVSLSVHGEQATAIFTSASASVRDAIENALPRLREVLLESGIQLGQAQVGSESPQQSPTRDENGDNRGNAVAAGHDTRALPPGFATNAPTAWISSGRGMIDVFA